MKDLQVLIKLSETEKSAFKKAAELSGVGLSTWARQKLRIASAKELQEVGQKADFLPDSDEVKNDAV